jgi:hypothetical protein
LGGNGADGDLVLFRNDGDNVSTTNASIHLDGQGGNIWAGGNGCDGDLVLKANDGTKRIRLDAGGGNIWLGGNGADGDLVLFSNSGDNETLSQATIHLNGDSGDILLYNADCAEEFDIEDHETAEPGTVMVVGDNGLLVSKGTENNTRVVGVVSGTDRYKPGIVLDKRDTGKKRARLALMGKVMCKVDADNVPIEAGDLLTTSSIRGHAMKCMDPAKSVGSIIGKALQGLDKGTGMIPVLVNLQ